MRFGLDRFTIIGGRSNFNEGEMVPEIIHLLFHGFSFGTHNSNFSMICYYRGIRVMVLIAVGIIGGRSQSAQ